MKKIILVGLILALAISLICVSCGGKETTAPSTTSAMPSTTSVAPSTTSAMPSTTSAAPSTTTKTIELKLSTHMPPTGAEYTAFTEWVQKISDATGGSVKITIYPSGTLVGETEVLDAVKSGLADIGHVPLNIYSNKFPLSDIMNLPFIKFNPEKGYEIWRQLEAKHPEIQAEYKDYKVLAYIVYYGGSLHTNNKPVRTPSDVSGDKLITFGDPMTQLMQKLGASPMMLALSDWYTSLEKGLAQGLWMTWNGIDTLKLYDVTKYHTNFPSVVTADTNIELVLMNMDTWNKLSPDQQKAFDDLVPWFSQTNTELIDNEILSSVNNISKMSGQEVVTITPDEENLWADEASSIQDKYISGVGGAAQDIYQDLQSLINQ